MSDEHHEEGGGGVIGGLFPGFRKKYLSFLAFHGFFSDFPVSATSQSTSPHKTFDGLVLARISI